MCSAAAVSLLHLQPALCGWTHQRCPCPYALTTVIPRVCPYWGRQVPGGPSIHPPPPHCVHLLWLGSAVPERCGAHQCLVWAWTVPGKGNMRGAWDDGVPPRPVQSMPLGGKVHWRPLELWSLVCAMCEQRVTHRNEGGERGGPSALVISVGLKV